MKIACPRGWQRTYQWHGMTVHHTKVTILEGICDACDLCDIKNCRFYDTSPEATRTFIRTSAKAHTLEGLMWKLQEEDLKKQRG